MGVWLQDDTEKKSSSFLMGGHTDFSLFSPSTVVKNFSLDFWECFDKDHPRASCSIQIGISVDWTRICFQKSRGYCFRTISDACRNRGYLFWSRYVTRTIKLYLKRRVEKKTQSAQQIKSRVPPHSQVVRGDKIQQVIHLQGRPLLPFERGAPKWATIPRKTSLKVTSSWIAASIYFDRCIKGGPF